MFLSSGRLSFKFALLSGDQSADSESSNSEIYSTDEIVDFLITVESSAVEMKAIANVIGDVDLIALIDELKDSEPTRHFKGTRDEFFKGLIDFGKHATALHEKVYELLEQTTDSV